MCIPCSVRPTPDKGLGVFTDAKVLQGATIWRHAPGQYEVFNEEILLKRLDKGSKEEAVHLLTHIVSMEEFPGYMINVLDEGALINHSELPNMKRKSDTVQYNGSGVFSVHQVLEALRHSQFDLVASRDIEAGEELLMDYNAEPDDPGYYERACERYGVTWEWL